MISYLLLGSTSGLVDTLVHLSLPLVVGEGDMITCHLGTWLVVDTLVHLSLVEVVVEVADP